MNKAELLADLGSRDFVKSVSEPDLMETKPDGTKWYKVNIAETLQKTATYRNVDFYVFDEGEAEEAAYYKDRDPDLHVSPTTFRDYLREQFLADEDIVSWQMRKIDEQMEVGITEALIEDPDDATKLIPAMYLVGRTSGVFWKKQINIDPDVIAAHSRA